MKQHTTTEQTFKLISLGCDKPKHFIEGPTLLDSGYAYTIGDLIEMLPDIHPLYHDPYCFDSSFDTIKWVVGYAYDNEYVEVVSSHELIDALFDMCVKLKEEGVI